ncbi:MAG: ATP-binding protein, partial [Exilibacterium sp.]
LSQKVTNLLQMSRSLRGKLTPNLELQNPEEFVGGTLSKMKHRLSRHRIHTGLDDTLLVPLDLSLMEVVLSNLLDNAVRFSPEQTVITIAGQRGQDCYELSVSDEGSGFKSKDTQQLFEQFYRADNQAIGGTGLGLAISKAIVEAHGGRVTATNHLPRGATFTVRLPLADIETEMPIHE